MCAKLSNNAQFSSLHREAFVNRGGISQSSRKIQIETVDIDLVPPVPRAISRQACDRVSKSITRVAIHCKEKAYMVIHKFRQMIANPLTQSLWADIKASTEKP
jgi:hypothetical protein